MKVLAIGAHPDDIELMMAGTLFLLKNKGCEIHYLNLANGSCGSMNYDAEATIKIRRAEAQNAADFLGAEYHESLVNDIEILYELPLLRKLTAIVRSIAPDIVLTHYPFDYMEDHSNTCRLAVSASFCRNMPNFQVEPEQKPIFNDVALYHCLPAGLLDPLKNRIIPEIFIDVTEVMENKNTMLAMHKSQKDWLDRSQGFDAYLKTMSDWNLTIGEMSGRFKYAEGWIRHLPNGLSISNIDPLASYFKESQSIQR